MGGIEKRRKKTLKSFEDLDRHVSVASPEPRAHSLSSGATGEGGPTFEDEQPDPRDEQIEEAVQRFYEESRVKGTDLDALYAELFRSLPQESRESFKERLLQEADDQELDLELPADPVEEVSTTEEETATPLWSTLRRRNVQGDGDLKGRKYWSVGDGSIFIDSGKSEPLHLAPGQFISLRNKETGVFERYEWDGARFGEPEQILKPMTTDERKKRDKDLYEAYSPRGLEDARNEIGRLLRMRKVPREARAQFERGIQAMRTRKDGQDLRALLKELPLKTIDNSPYAEGSLEHAQENLSNRLKALRIDADRFVEFGKRIVAAKTPQQIRRLAREIAALERPREHAAAAIAPQEPDTAAAQEEAIPHVPRESATADGGFAQGAADPHRLKELHDMLAQLAKRNADKKPVESPEARAARLDREARELLKEARRGDFAIAEITADNWRGGPEQGAPNMYRHPGMPGYLFTQAQVDWVARREAGSKAAPAKRPRATEILPEKKKRAPAQRQAWSLEKAHRGLQPKTFEALIHDPHHGMYFPMLLRALSPDLAASLERKGAMREAPTAEEYAFAEYARHEYTRRKEDIESLQRAMNIETLEFVAQSDPAIQGLLGMRGAERTLDILRVQVLHLGMNSLEDFERMRDHWFRLEALRHGRQYRSLEKKLTTFLHKRGIDAHEYEETYGATDTKSERKQTIDRVQEQYRADMGIIGRAFDAITFRHMSRYDARRTVKRAAKINKKLGSDPAIAVHGHLSALKTALHHTLIENPYVSTQIYQEAIQRTNLRSAGEEGPRSHAEMQAVQTRSTAEWDRALLAHVGSYKKEGRGWSDLSPSERSESLAPLRERYADERRHSGGSIFAGMLRAILDAFFARKERELITQAA